MQIFLYTDRRGASPVEQWLQSLERRDAVAATDCLASIIALQRYGSQLRRPHADYLRDGIYELRVRSRRVHYRILYFFRGQEIVVLSHAFAKKGQVPSGEIDRAIRHRHEVESGALIIPLGGS